MIFKNNSEKGKFGENLAKDFLIKNKYKIIETNWHYSKNAEIDIIAKEKDTLVFVEVKTRKNLQCGHPFEAINPAKLQKIQTAVLGYISTTKEKFKSYRLDGIAITGFENPEIEHLKDIGRY